MDQDELPTILFIPSAWVEWAMDLYARTGQPVELGFYPTKIDRRAFQRRQTDEVLTRGGRHQTDRRTTMLDLLEPAHVEEEVRMSAS